jgi:hypothetical protein
MNGVRKNTRMSCDGSGDGFPAVYQYACAKSSAVNADLSHKKVRLYRREI